MQSDPEHSLCSPAARSEHSSPTISATGTFWAHWCFFKATSNFQLDNQTALLATVVQLTHYRASITLLPSPCLPKKGQGFFSSLLSASTLPTTERLPVQLRLLSCMHFNEGMYDRLWVPLNSTISAGSFCGCMCCTAGKANFFQGSQNA